MGCAVEDGPHAISISVMVHDDELLIFAGLGELVPQNVVLGEFGKGWKCLHLKSG